MHALTTATANTNTTFLAAAIYKSEGKTAFMHLKFHTNQARYLHQAY